MSLYRLFVYSNAASPTKQRFASSITGALIERRAATSGSKSTSPVIGVGHFGRRENHRTRQYCPIHLKGTDLAAWRESDKPRYFVPLERSTFQVSTDARSSLPYFTQFLVEKKQISQDHCLLQLCPGFRYGGTLITGDIPPEKRSVLQDSVEDAEPFDVLLEEGVEILLQGEAAASQSVFWAPQYLLLLPKDLVIRVEYGGSSNFPVVIDYIRFNGETVEIKTPEERFVENPW